MIIQNQFIEIKWLHNNKKYYTDLGYEFTKIGDTFFVKAEDLSHGSKRKIKVQCDYCGIIFEVAVYNYYRSIKKKNIIACANCKTNKTRETLQSKYGVSAPCQYEKFNQKMKDTCLEKYGTTCALANKEIRQKAQNTLLEKYGVSYPVHSNIIKQKINQTNIERYGTIYISQNESIKEKIRNTNLQRYGTPVSTKSPQVIQKMKETCKAKYGGESSQCDVAVRQKSLSTMYKNGTIPSSTQEKEMVELLKKIYGEDNCQPQFNCDKLSFDCLLTIGDIKIDVEFDGWYWHKDKQHKDRKRNYFVMSQGYRVLRFISKNSLTEKDIIDGVNYLINNNHRCHIVKLDNI